MRPIRHVRTSVIVAFALAGIVTNCSQPPTAPTVPPTPPPAPAPSDPNPVASLSGVVFEVTEQGRRPIPGAKVFVVDLVEGPYGYLGWHQLTSDISGRFFLGNAPAGRLVKITAYETPGGGPLFNQSDLLQVSAVHVTVDGETTVEIELVRLGVQPRLSSSPVLSGVVFESTPEGRRPARDMAVLYSSNSHDGADAYTRTDAEGRYRFWNLPIGAGYVLPACTRSRTLPPSFHAVTIAVDILGDTVRDADCL